MRQIPLTFTAGWGATSGSLHDMSNPSMLPPWRATRGGSCDQPGTHLPVALYFPLAVDIFGLMLPVSLRLRHADGAVLT
jgi:hypothetical protein